MNSQQELLGYLIISFLKVKIKYFLKLEREKNALAHMCKIDPHPKSNPSLGAHFIEQQVCAG